MPKNLTGGTSRNVKEGLLLQPILFGDLKLPNRVVMAPLTRMRTPSPGAIPNELMREYYEQRASAGLIISEGTFVSDQARGWFGAPGVYTEEQRKGWQTITDAVHRAGGHMIVQLWHQGSVSSRGLVGHGRSPLGPSAVNPDQLVHTDYGVTEMTQVPKEMTLDDIKTTIAEFRHASKVARDAGFDGVQIQGGFVYLFQQFMQEALNLRTDSYGGSIENRARLVFEVLEAVLEVWPSSRVGVKTGPMMPERGGFRSSASTLPTAEYVYRRLNDYHLSHVMLMRQQADLSGTPIESLRGDGVLHHFRKLYSGTLMLNVDISPERGEQLLREGLGEMIAFGREYIANPDLVERIRTGSQFNPQRPEGYYGATAEGYTDYPTIPRRRKVRCNMPDFDPVGTIEFFRERHRVESATTAKVLRAIPADMLSYRAHPGSSTAGTTAWTIVRCLQVSNHLTHSDSTEVPRSHHPDHEALLAEFVQCAEALQQKLISLNQVDWLKERTLISNGVVILEQPLGQILWLFLFDGIHHRGQLSTYLRPMGAAVPSIYGPSADTTA